MEENTEPSFFVVDTSFVLSYLFPDERLESVSMMFEQNFAGKADFISPKLLVFEICNALKNSILRKRLNEKTAVLLLENFFNLKIRVVEVPAKETLSLSVEKNLTFYDACYLQLATEKGLPLLSLDRDLEKFSFKFNN